MREVFGEERRSMETEKGVLLVGRKFGLMREVVEDD